MEGNQEILKRAIEVKGQDGRFRIVAYATERGAEFLLKAREGTGAEQTLALGTIHDDRMAKIKRDVLRDLDQAIPRFMGATRRAIDDGSIFAEGGMGALTNYILFGGEVDLEKIRGKAGDDLTGKMRDLIEQRDGLIREREEEKRNKTQATSVAAPPERQQQAGSAVATGSSVEGEGQGKRSQKGTIFLHPSTHQSSSQGDDEETPVRPSSQPVQAIEPTIGVEAGRESVGEAGFFAKVAGEIAKAGVSSGDFGNGEEIRQVLEQVVGGMLPGGEKIDFFGMTVVIVGGKIGVSGKVGVKSGNFDGKMDIKFVLSHGGDVKNEDMGRLVLEEGWKVGSLAQRTAIRIVKGIDIGSEIKQQMDNVNEVIRQALNSQQELKNRGVEVLDAIFKLSGGSCSYVFHGKTETPA